MIGKLGPGAVVGLRGPYGRGWPIEQARGRDVLLVAGGLGLAPLRPAVESPPGRPRPVRPPHPRSTEHASRPTSSTPRSIPSGSAGGWRS